MTDKDPRKNRIYARPGDPTSPYIWGMMADLLRYGGVIDEAWEAAYAEEQRLYGPESQKVSK